MGGLVSELALEGGNKTQSPSAIEVYVNSTSPIEWHLREDSENSDIMNSGGYEKYIGYGWV